MTKEGNIIGIDIADVINLLSKPSDPIKTDKLGLKYDEKTGIIVGEDGKPLSSDKIFSTLMNATKKNESPVFLADDNHSFRQKIDNLRESLKIIKEAGYAFGIENSEDRVSEWFGLNPNKKFADIELDEIINNKELFIENSRKDIIAKDTKNVATTFYNLLLEAKKIDLEMVFIDPSKEAREKMKTQVNHVMDSYKGNEREKNNTYFQVLGDIRNINSAEEISSKNGGKVATLVGMYHIAAQSDLDEKVAEKTGKKSVTVIMMNRDADKRFLEDMSDELVGIYDKFKEKGLLKKLEDVGLLKDYENKKSIQTPDYIYVASDNGGKGALYKAEEYLKDHNIKLKILEQEPLTVNKKPGRDL